MKKFILSMLFLGFAPVFITAMEMEDKGSSKETGEDTPVRRLIVDAYKTKELRELLPQINDETLDKAVQLVREGADPNIQHHNGTTLLWLAAAHGNSNAVADLLNMGSHPDIVDNAGYTPLNIATVFGHTAIVRLLLQHGANLSLAAQILGTSDRYVEPPITNPLNTAILLQNTGLVSLLLSYGADPNKYSTAEQNVMTPLFNVFLPEEFEHRIDSGILHILLEYGADANTVTQRDSSTTCLHEAASEDRLNHVVLLTNYGAQLNARTSEVGSTPLHWAAECEAFITTAFLIAIGADNTPNDATQLPIDLVSEDDQLEQFLHDVALVPAQDRLTWVLNYARQHNYNELVAALEHYSLQKIQHMRQQAQLNRAIIEQNEAQVKALLDEIPLSSLFTPAGNTSNAVILAYNIYINRLARLRLVQRMQSSISVSPSSLEAETSSSGKEEEEEIEPAPKRQKRALDFEIADESTRLVIAEQEFEVANRIYEMMMKLVTQYTLERDMLKGNIASHSEIFPNEILMNIIYWLALQVMRESYNRPS